MLRHRLVWLGRHIQWADVRISMISCALDGLLMMVQLISSTNRVANYDEPYPPRTRCKSVQTGLEASAAAVHA